jgi:hypothetical protein
VTQNIRNNKKTGMASMENLISGLISFLTTVVVMGILLRRSRQSPPTGQLCHGYFLPLLGSACLAFVAYTIAAATLQDELWQVPSELLSAIAIVIGFSMAAAYCFIEFFFTRGHYDEKGVVFRSGWSGTTIESWDDLLALDFDPFMGWYLLRFRSGRKVRISALLLGHWGVLEQLAARGYKTEGLQALH